MHLRPRENPGRAVFWITFEPRYQPCEAKPELTETRGPVGAIKVHLIQSGTPAPLSMDLTLLPYPFTDQ